MGPVRRGGQALREKKKELRELKKNLSQSREAAKASGSQTERTTISLRLPTAGRSLRLCERKKKE